VETKNNTIRSMSHESKKDIVDVMNYDGGEVNCEDLRMICEN
jgi:hypothetical protein